MKPEIRIDLVMKLERDGGRHAPATEGYCPHLVAEGSQTWLGVRASACPQPVVPGERAVVGFELMYHPSVDYAGLTPGTKVVVLEGAHVVGEGTVVGPLERAPR